MADAKSISWIIRGDDPFNAVAKPRTILENRVLSAEVEGADFLPLLRRKNKPEHSTLKEAKIAQIARSLEYLINNVNDWAVPYTEHRVAEHL